MSIGERTWVLSTKKTKQYEVSVPSKTAVELIESVLTDLKLEGVETAKEIHYWGHYPVVYRIIKAAQKGKKLVK